MSGKVIIKKTSGNLGGLAPKEDGVSAIIAQGTKPSNVNLNDVLRFTTVEDAIAAGIDEAYDRDNNLSLYRQIADFFSAIGGTGELFVMVVDKATTLATIMDKDQNYAAKLLRETSVNNRIRLLAVVTDSYAKTTADAGDLTVNSVVTSIKNDLHTALGKANSLAEEAFENQRPLNILFEGCIYGDITNLPDLKIEGYDHVSVVISADNDVSKISKVVDEGTPDEETVYFYKNYANVGYCLGELSKLPVQRSLGRVKNGASNVINAGFSNNTTFPATSIGHVELADSHGYIYLTKRSGKGGYYWNADHTATGSTSDYKYIHRGRTIDKVARLAYAYYTNELNDDVLVDADGKLSPGVIKVYQNGIEEDINRNMVGEISSVSAFVDPNQNILSTNEIQVSIDIVPKGLAENIRVTLGFKNPQIN